MLHRVWLLAVFFAAALLPVIPTAAQGDELPDAYLGRWEGTVTESNPNNRYPVTISLTGGPIGSIVGAITYPMCGSDVSLVSVTGNQSSIELSESITYGKGACIDGGTVVLTAMSDGSLGYRWSHPGFSVIATATLTPVGEAATPTTLERSDVAFTFGDEVMPEDEALIREAIRFAQDAYAAMFGVDITELVSVEVGYDPENAQFSNYALGHRIGLNTWNFRGYSPLMRVMFIIHEYFHVVQNDLSGLRVAGGDQMGPQWLIEGSADFVAFRALADADLLNYDDAHEFMVLMANGLHAQDAVTLPLLSELQTAQDMFEPGVGCCSYALSSLAVELLTEEAGIESLASYFAQLRDGTPWPTAFEEAFGLSPDAFYDAFETQRAAILLPAGRDGGWLDWTPPFNAVPADISIVSAPSSVVRGDQALLTGWTAAGAHCTLTFMSPDGAHLLSQPTYADAYGNVFWLWSIAPDLAPGSTTAEVSCGAVPVAAPVELR